MLHLLFLGLPVIVAGGPAQLPAIPDWENARSSNWWLPSRRCVRRTGSKSPSSATLEEGYHLYGPEEAPPTATVVELVEAARSRAGKPAYPIRSAVISRGSANTTSTRAPSQSGFRSPQLSTRGPGGSGSSGPGTSSAPTTRAVLPPARRWNSSSPWKGRGARCGNCIPKSSESPNERGEEPSDERGHEQGGAHLPRPRGKSRPVRCAKRSSRTSRSRCALACTAGSPPSTA